MPNGIDDTGTGALIQALATQGTTTPEGRARAEDILRRYEEGEAFAPEQELMKRMKDTADTSRQALIDARAKILGRERDTGEKWFRLASALARPTRTGHWAESLGYASDVMADELERQREFERAQQQEAFGLTQQIAGIDQSMIEQELALAMARRKAEAGLAGKALSILGKPITPPRQKTALAMDKEYIPEFSRWQTQGAAEAAKNLTELSIAVESLRTREDISGPMVGILPKPVRDVFVPESGTTQDAIEGIAQSSMKEILGSQFTQTEGQMLLARVFNPRLGEGENYKRASRLLKQLQEAAKNNQKKAEYFEEHGTLEGFKGVKRYSIEDFLLPEEKEEMTFPDGTKLVVPKGITEEQARTLYQERTGKVPGFKEGGAVTFAERFGTTGEVSPTEIEEEEDSLIGDVLTGAGLGALTGYGATDIGTRLMGMRDRLTPLSPAEKQILTAQEIGGEDLSQVATEIKRAQRQKVPTTLMEAGSPATRQLAEQALIAGGEKAEEVLEDVEERYKGARQRVTEKVNRALKPYPYFKRMDKLTSDLYENAKPLYEEAYAKYPGISLEDVPALEKILEAPDGKKAVKIAIRLLRNEGKKTGKEDAVGMVRRPSLEFLDYVKRGFDQLISKEEDKGSTPLGRSMRGLRNELREQLDIIAPEYKTARAQYAGDLEVLDALQRGREEFALLQPEEVVETLEGMTPAEHRSYRTGVAQKLYEIINAPSTEVNAARRLIGSPAMKQKLEALFPKQSEARIFREGLERELKLFEQTKKMTGRVERGRERRMQQELEKQQAGIRKSIREKLPSPVYSPLMAAIRFLTRPRLRLTPTVADEIAETLNAGTPEEINKLVKRLEPATKRRKRGKKWRGKAAGVGAAIGALTAPFLDDEIDTED